MPLCGGKRDSEARFDSDAGSAGNALSNLTRPLYHACEWVRGIGIRSAMARVARGAWCAGMHRLPPCGACIIPLGDRAGATGMALGTGLGTAYTQIAAAPDYSLRIALLRLELAAVLGRERTLARLVDGLNAKERL